MRSEQAESVKPCVLQGVSKVLSEAGSRVGRVEMLTMACGEYGAHTRWEG